MDNNHIINNIFRESIKVATDVGETLSNDIIEISSLIFARLMNGNKIMACGNGGSAGDSQHFASELVNRFEIDRNELAALALTTDSSTITSIANDYGYEEIFSKQISALGKKNDILLAITTSGNSQNIYRAIKQAQNNDITVILLTGRDGGKASSVLMDRDKEIRIPSNSTARIQESHLIIIHCICSLIENKMVKNNEKINL